MRPQFLKFLLLSALLLATAAGFSESYNEPPTGSGWYLKSAQSGTENAGYWDQPAMNSSFKPGDKISLYAKDGYNDQKFFFQKAPEQGWYFIRSANGFGCIDVPGGKNANGVQLIIYKCNQQNNQKFRFKYLGDFRWKIYTSGGRAIGTPRSFSNGASVHTWDDHEGPWMEWYIENASGSRYEIARPLRRVIYKGKLDDAIASKNPGEQYFEYASGDQFATENLGVKIQDYLNAMKSPSDQWNAILGIVKGTSRNQDPSARSNIYQALSQVNVLQKGSFVENILKGQVQKQIRDIARREKEASAKQFLEVLGNKF